MQENNIHKKAREMFDEKFRENYYKTVPTDLDVKGELVKDFIDSIIDLAITEEQKKFLSTLDDDSCECDNCNRTRKYFQNPNKELLRYKNKCEVEVKKAITEERKRAVEINENTSDGYHTFKELYEYRKIYNALAFNEWAKQGIYNVHKSKKHSDGESCFGGGWFIVVAELPTGQISNHYELKDWDLFKCEEKEIPNKYDNHSPQNVTERIINLITNTNK